MRVGIILPLIKPTVIAELIKLFNSLDEKIINTIIMIAKNKIKENHLLPYHVDQFKSFYSKLFKDYE